jgi:two-component system sensor kinase FixL
MTFRSLFLKPDSRRGPWAYALAVLFSAAALGLTAYLDARFDGSIRIVLAMPIILAAYWGGFGPGVLAMVTTVLGLNYFLLPPIGSFAVDSSLERVKEIILVVEGLIISGICERLHQERRRAEREQVGAERGQQASAQLAAIIASSDDAIIGKDLNGIVTSWNPASTRMFGYSEAEMIGSPITLLIPPELLVEEDRIIWMVKAGQHTSHYETTRIHKSGRKILVSLSVSPIRDARGRIAGAAKIARDITEQKAAEAHLHMLQAELAHSARLNTMGEMSAALAHELNQPLTAITNYVKAAQRMLTDDDVAPQKLVLVKEAMRKAAEQVQRTGGIIHRLREFVEKREVKREAEHLNAIVESAVALGFVGTTAGGVKMKLVLSDEDPMVRIDRIQIQQVLLNVIRNGIEAMAGSEERLMTITTGRDDAWARVTISDTGSGLPPDILAALFKPFTTTKQDGMGIGLTICQSIMASHSGSIQGRSGSRGGAVFDIQLPLLDEAAEALQAAGGERDDAV